MSQDQLDINAALGKRATISLGPEESAEEQTVRLRKERMEATFEIVKSYVIFFVIVIVMVGLGALCVFEAVFDSTSTPDTKRIAWTLLSSLFTGSVSFVLGQKTAKK